MGGSSAVPLRLSGGVWLGGAAGQAGAVHDVGVQHLQQQVVQRDHVLHLHAVQVVHAFVAAQSRDSGDIRSEVKVNL